MRLLSDLGLNGLQKKVGSTLLNGLVSYWPLDETSGARDDSVGSNDLADNGTVGYSAGAMHNAAASFVAGNAESLSKGAWDWDAAGYYDSGWTLAFWYKAAGDQYFLLNKDNVTYREFNLARISGRINDYWANVQTATTDGGDNTWNLLVFSYNPADDKVYLYLNDDAGNSGASGITTAGPSAFEIGGRSATAQYATCLIDEVGLWSRVLTADERTELYNSGSGAFYPF